jgi:hypothetical protein
MMQPAHEFVGFGRNDRRRLENLTGILAAPGLPQPGERAIAFSLRSAGMERELSGTTHSKQPACRRDALELTRFLTAG